MPERAVEKEPQCTRCVHRDVCSYKKDYLDILGAVENTSVLDETEDGNILSKKVTDYDFISGISVGCRYYRNWTNIYRDGDYNA